MKHFEINPEKVIKVEFTGVASILNPTLYKDGDSYCCILGPDPESGVIGCGRTPEKAVHDWDEHLKVHLSTASPSNAVVKIINAILLESRKPTEQLLQSKGMESHIASIEDPSNTKRVKDLFHKNVRQ